jgi:hypothetical protein
LSADQFLKGVTKDEGLASFGEPLALFLGKALRIRLRKAMPDLGHTLVGKVVVEDVRGRVDEPCEE